MNAFQKRALDLLEEILAAAEGKRTTRLLPCPQSDEAPIGAGLRECSWSEGWAFNVPDSMAKRLDIQYGERVVNKRKTALWTQGTNFDFSNCTFHGKDEHKNIVLQVVEWFSLNKENSANCVVSVYSVKNNALSFERKESMGAVELLKTLILGWKK